MFNLLLIANDLLNFSNTIQIEEHFNLESLNNESLQV